MFQSKGDAYRSSLTKSVEQLHNAKALWDACVAVREVVDGRVVWEGKVHVYRLIGNDKAIRCFAWETETAEGARLVQCVLQEPPIQNAADAVRAVLARANDKKS